MTTESPILSIEITKEIPIFGNKGDTLQNRLRNVVLRGFPDVKIYENASFEAFFLAPLDIEMNLHTSQTGVYKSPNLERIQKLAQLFLEKEIDILNLKKAYDYTATHESGEETEWTMLLPIVERFYIPANSEGNLDYSSLIGNKLSVALKQKNLGLNQEVSKMPKTSAHNYYNLINDGSHRVHHGFLNSGVRILRITNMTPGFPYYAAPQKYAVKLFETREEALKESETKIHIIQSPGHKDLYRVFPSGGIKSGNVRQY